MFQFSLIGRLNFKGLNINEVQKVLEEQWKLGDRRCKLVPMTKGFFIIKLTSAEDNERVWHGATWVVHNQQLRVYNFYPNFDPERQNTSRAAVWVSFPGLYIELWTKRILLSIAKILGRPIAIDQKTLDHDVGNYATVLIDIDFAKEIPKRIYLKANGKEFWQYVEVQDIEKVKFCSHCKFIGHKFENFLAARKILGSLIMDGKRVLNDTAVNPKTKKEWKLKKPNSDVVSSHDNHAVNVNKSDTLAGVISSGVGVSSNQEKGKQAPIIPFISEFTEVRSESSIGKGVIHSAVDNVQGNKVKDGNGNVVIDQECADDKQLEEDLNSSLIEYREAQLKLIRCKNAIAAKKDLDVRNNFVHEDHADQTYSGKSQSVQTNSEVRSVSNV
ncbi:uncharacterized protein LOC113345787 [Papaver somniferum]|uniref:uncharacterized protein LOC113345787 n=1 Tax=Papaver somniferum TaxID=3469 RepID=UPI000E6FE666|nr:uncharacterized protein LOC113345787 [Papaver somniferum]